MEKSIINLILYDISKSLREGEIKPYELETELFSRTKSSYSNEDEAWLESCENAQKLRSEFLKQKTGVQLSYSTDSHIVNGIKRKGRYVTRVENMYGASQTPMGFAGPLKVTGFDLDEQFFSGEFYFPLSHNEAGLAAALNRGCKFLNETDGVEAKITKDKMTRAPLIKCPDKEYADKVIEWLQNPSNFKRLQEIVQKTTSYGRLLDVEIVRGEKHPNVFFPRFGYFTGDAMGMNMITIPTNEVCKEIEREWPEADTLALSGNVCSDKKQTKINKERGRGLSIKTSVTLKKELLEKEDLTAQDIEEINYLKNDYGSELAGTIGGYNGHVANPMAAIMVSTGQDVAQLVENSTCTTYTKALENGDLEFGCDFPVLELGTVGGGTDTPTASESLKVLGVYGSGNPPGSNRKKFGCLVASICTAGEYNHLVVMKRKELAETHAKLTGRI
jgi:hydroxymethylglutaryl-CoA reductase (NADPH)